MPEAMNDLLADPVFGIRRGGARTSVSLPEVLERLGADDVDAFTGLQAHQAHAWHAFLVQLAALVLHPSRAKGAALPAKRWREGLLSLADGEPGAWRLVEGDLRKPAFMQPPVPERKLDRWNGPFAQPDEIDVLVTAKNHDVKGARIRNPRAELWAYALVNLQTMQGVLGAGKYGIARMNKGYGSRPAVSVASSLRLGVRFTRDVKVLLGSRRAIQSLLGTSEDAGMALLWLDPWNGKKSLQPSACDPFFIEVCRRVRLTGLSGVIAAWTRATETARIAAEQLKGNMGDPWTPIHKQEGKAFTATRAGFHYRVTQDLLFGGDYQPAPAQAPASGEVSAVLLCRVLARGMGETNGLHERVLPLPANPLAILRKADGRDRLGALARRRVALVDEVQQRSLKPALLALLQGAPEKLTFKDDRPRRWLDAHDARVDAVFFECLWRDMDLPETEADRRWLATVTYLARDELRRAVDSVPLPAVRRYRAQAAAERILEGSFRNRYPQLFENPGEVGT